MFIFPIMTGLFVLCSQILGAFSTLDICGDSAPVDIEFQYTQEHMEAMRMRLLLNRFASLVGEVASDVVQATQVSVLWYSDNVAVYHMPALIIVLLFCNFATINGKVMSTRCKVIVISLAYVAPFTSIIVQTIIRLSPLNMFDFAARAFLIVYLARKFSWLIPRSSGLLDIDIAPVVVPESKLEAGVQSAGPVDPKHHSSVINVMVKQDGGSYRKILTGFRVQFDFKVDNTIVKKDCFIVAMHKRDKDLSGDYSEWCLSVSGTGENSMVLHDNYDEAIINYGLEVGVFVLSNRVWKTFCSRNSIRALSHPIQYRDSGLCYPLLSRADGVHIQVASPYRVEGNLLVGKYYTEPGDSGSPILSADGKVIAVHNCTCGKFNYSVTLAFVQRSLMRIFDNTAPTLTQQESDYGRTTRTRDDITFHKEGRVTFYRLKGDAELSTKDDVTIEDVVLRYRNKHTPSRVDNWADMVDTGHYLKTIDFSKPFVLPESGTEQDFHVGELNSPSALKGIVEVPPKVELPLKETAPPKVAKVSKPSQETAPPKVAKVSNPIKVVVAPVTTTPPSQSTSKESSSSQGQSSVSSTPPKSKSALRRVKRKKSSKKTSEVTASQMSQVKGKEKAETNMLQLATELYSYALRLPEEQTLSFKDAVLPLMPGEKPLMMLLATILSTSGRWKGLERVQLENISLVLIRINGFVDASGH